MNTFAPIESVCTRVECRNQIFALMFPLCLENGVTMTPRRRLLTLIFSCLSFKKSLLIKSFMLFLSFFYSLCKTNTNKELSLILRKIWLIVRSDDTTFFWLTSNKPQRLQIKTIYANMLYFYCACYVYNLPATNLYYFKS